MRRMKFAHLADCHLGAWSRKPELQELNLRSFEYAIDKCISEKVTFVLVAGDFFDTSFPTNTALLSRVFAKLRQLKEKNIPLYLIPGSHDFSVSGESLLKVIEAAGLCKNLMNLLSYDGNSAKLSLQREEGLAITGILGRRGSLELDIMKALDKKSLENAVKKTKSLKIFLVHTAISELLPEELKSELGAGVEAISYESLPAGFHYYAAGHIHEAKIINSSSRDSNSVIAYSGCLFPNNFAELAKIKHGSFIIAHFDEKTEKLVLREEKIKFKDVCAIDIGAENKTAAEVEAEIISSLEKEELWDKILTLKVSGTLKSGRISEINFENVYRLIEDSECFSFLRNTHGLSTTEFAAETVKGSSVEEIESSVVESSLKSLTAREEQAEKKKLIETLLTLLNKEKAEDERKEDFADRLVNEILNSLNLHSKF